MAPVNQAAWLDGGGKKLRVADSEYPSPGADEIVIKNHAIAINPVDWKIQDHGLFIKNWPAILGTDMAGEVVEVGSNVSKFKKGDRVISHSVALATGNNAGAGFQLYSTAPAATSVVLPSNVSYNEGVVLPLAIDTAAVGLYSKDKGFLGLQYPSLNPTSSGKTIVVWGGSASVGTAVIQLAVASGAKVVAVASKHNHDFVKSLGASEAVDYNNPSVVEDVVKAVQSIGGDFAGAYDAISNEASYKYVAPIVEKLGGGSVAIVLPPPQEGPENVQFGSVFGVSPITHQIWSEYLGPALEQGKLKAVPEPLVVGKGLESVQKGLDTNKAGVSAKKVVIELV
ncbi:related to oxidoreductase [Ramularia collo-cygni]|uniref:Related to oxidoreductase n=1 Tax=Ramularia collo-cygni TaxID=112498 RepID=A0A2D3UQ17_9PEZI|nr:related to oxidoreductase [Ramularia collo-cygni]CZT17671.1 related to oxidoreductase [Ramularia collo-cygni]